MTNPGSLASHESALQRIAGKLGDAPTIVEYRDAKLPNEPSERSIRRAWDTADRPWLSALYAAGLDPDPGRHGGRGSSDLAFLIGLRLAGSELREWPSPDQYRDVNGSPSVTTIYNRFESWDAARDWCADRSWRDRSADLRFPAEFYLFLSNIRAWAMDEAGVEPLRSNHYEPLYRDMAPEFGWPNFEIVRYADR